MPGSLTSGFLWSRWQGKRSQHSQRMRNPPFYVSGKRPMGSHPDIENPNFYFPISGNQWGKLPQHCSICPTEHIISRNELKDLSNRQWSHIVIGLSLNYISSNFVQSENYEYVKIFLTSCMKLLRMVLPLNQWLTYSFNSHSVLMMSKF